MSTIELQNVSSDSLIAELRRRGMAVCVFQESDVSEMLADDDDLRNLSEREIDSLAGTALVEVRKRLETRLSGFGNEVLEDLLAINKGVRQAKDQSEARGKLVDELVASFSERGVLGEALDDIVLDNAAELGAEAANKVITPEEQDAALNAEMAKGALINNNGLHAQMVFILDIYGEQAGREKIEEAAAIWLAGHQPLPR